MFGRGGTQSGQVGRNGGRAAGTIPLPGFYPVSRVNQLGGVGHRALNGMFGPSADGVNTAQINAGIARVRAGPRTWGL